MDLESRGIVLSVQRKTKVLICFFIFACVINQLLTLVSVEMKFSLTVNFVILISASCWPIGGLLFNSTSCLVVERLTLNQEVLC